MRKVFIIEDDLELSKVYERAFRLGGFEVELSGNGIESFERLTHMDSLPEIVILDATVPEVDGVDILNKITQAERLSGISVILLTNSSDPDEHAHLMSLGARMCLTKLDLEPRMLVQKAGEYLRDYEQAESLTA